MKRLLSCLTACALLLLGAVPGQAIPQTAPPHMVTSMEELLGWYGGLSGGALREGVVTKPVVCKGEVVLGVTPCRVDITFTGGLHILAGARLTIDNPNLVLMGPPPVITVEPGGVLHIKRQHAQTAQAMPQGGIVVQAGGTLLIDAGATLPDGMVIDQNPPSNTLPPPTPEAPDETPAPETPEPELPDETPKPEAPDKTPPAEETLSITGEVLKVSAQGSLLAMLTLPCVDPARTETIVIERSADAKGWNTEYIFRWNEEALGFISDERPEFGRMVSKNRIDGSKTDFKYLARLSGKPFYLRAVLTQADGSKVVSDAIRLTEPPVGQYPGSDDYEDSGGNRGGGGQGTTNREEQKETAASRPDSAVDTEPQITLRVSAGTASAEAPSVSTTALQEAALAAQGTTEQQAAQGTAEQQTTPGTGGAPTQVNPPAPSGQVAPEQSKPLGSTARNWLVIAATLVLCGAIWVFTTKRKKS